MENFLREYSIRSEKSPYFGLHKVYESPEEFNKDFPGVKLKRWSEFLPEEVQDGEWLIADDGYVVQLLKKSGPYVTKRDKTCYFFRFAMGTFVGYWVKTLSIWKYRNFCAQFTAGRRNAATSEYKIRTDKGILEKIKFATLLASGVKPMSAFNLSITYGAYLTREQAIRKVLNLLRDEVVQKEIKNQLVKFREDIDEKFGDKRLVEELDMLLKYSKKGTIAHRENINFIMELRGIIQPEPSRKKIAQQAEEAQITELPPAEEN